MCFFSLLFRWRSAPWCTSLWRTTTVWLMGERPSLSCGRSSQWLKTPGSYCWTCKPSSTPDPTRPAVVQQCLHSPSEHYRNCRWCFFVLHTREKKGILWRTVWVLKTDIWSDWQWVRVSVLLRSSFWVWGFLWWWCWCLDQKIHTYDMYNWCSPYVVFYIQLQWQL